MTHAFGGVPGADESVRTLGSSTNRLVDIGEIDPVSGIPRMSAIPVKVVVPTLD